MKNIKKISRKEDKKELKVSYRMFQVLERLNKKELCPSDLSDLMSISTSDRVLRTLSNQDMVVMKPKIKRRYYEITEFGRKVYNLMKKGITYD